MYSKNPTGVGIYTKEVWNKLYKNLDGKNIEYSFYSYYNDGSDAFNKQKQVKLPFFLQLFLKKFISVHRLVWNIFYLPFVAKNYNLVYSFSSHGSPFIKNQVITIHDLICFTYPKQHKFQFFYFRYILPSIIKGCKKIVVVSNFTKQEVLKHYNIKPEKIVVIYNGGDHLQSLHNNSAYDDVCNLNKQINGSFFLSVGASYKHKNTEMLLQAMKLMKTNAKLVIVGAVNKYFQHLKTFIETEQITNVILVKYVSSACLSWLYNNCIANVYISLYEGFGFPPLEAAVHNKVTILSNSTALLEIYKDAALFVNPQSLYEISNALEEVQSPSFNGKKYLNNSKLLVEKYKWKTTAEKLQSLIVNLIKNN